MKQIKTIPWLCLILLLCLACQPLPPITNDLAPRSDIATTAAVTNLTLTDPIPSDPAVRIGQLDNGLTYYIRHNTEPSNRAALWLALNAGSLQETEEQLGLAHLVEHMLFNGTRHFEKQELIDYLELIGMEPGPDVNAFTGFDETVYMLQVPTDDSELIGTAFDILEDWAGYATLDPAEIDKERGVVIEEWRLRDENAWGRVMNRQWETWLEGSRYAERLPIGDMEIIRNAAPETLKDFYETWYRPDLMAIIAVGDFDVDAIENQIYEHFTSLPVPADPQHRESYPIPLNGTARNLVITDPEFPFAGIEVSFLREKSTVETVRDYRTDLVGELFRIMLNNRLDELSRQADAPFLFGVAYEGDFVGPAELSVLFAQVQDDGVAQGLDALITEVQRARQHGFTATELARAKIDLVRQAEQAYDERNNVESNNLAFGYMDHFFSASYLPSVELQLQLAQELAPTISLDEVNARIDSFVGETDRLVTVTAPEKAGLTVPDEAELAAIITEAEGRAAEPYADEDAATELFAAIPEPVAIASASTIDDLATTELLLDNGVRVLLKPTDFKDDEVVFGAISPGGSSLMAAEDVDEAMMISRVVGESGVGEANYSALQKLLTGKNVNVFPWIGGINEGLWGDASAKDMATLFQLIHLYFTQPRADADAFSTWHNQERAWLANRDLEPESALDEAEQEIFCGDEPRCQQLTLDSLETVELDRGFALYQERFADADDFTFIFVGSFDLAEGTELAQRYLGTLPTLSSSEAWRDVSIPPPTGIHTRTLYKGQAERSVVRMMWAQLVETAGPVEQTAMDALTTILDIRLRDQLREELGGTYGAWVMGHTWDTPQPESQFFIEFSCDPARAEELTAVVWAEIEKLQRDGPSADDMAKFKAQSQRNREEELEQNQSWLGWLEHYAETPDESLATFLNFTERIDAITAEDVRAAAHQYLPLDAYVQLVLYPEAYE